MLVVTELLLLFLWQLIRRKNLSHTNQKACIPFLTGHTSLFRCSSVIHWVTALLRKFPLFQIELPLNILAAV